MDKSIWRPRSRFVAFVNLIYTTIKFCVTGFMLLFVLMGLTTKVIKATGNHQTTLFLVDLDTKDLWIMLAVIVVAGCILGVDLWAVIMLLKAATPKADPQLALPRAKIWRNVNIVFMLLTVVCYALISQYWSILGEVVVRGVMLFVVQKFIQELPLIIGSGSTLPSARDTDSC